VLAEGYDIREKSVSCGSKQMHNKENTGHNIDEVII